MIADQADSNFKLPGYPLCQEGSFFYNRKVLSTFLLLKALRGDAHAVLRQIASKRYRGSIKVGLPTLILILKIYFSSYIFPSQIPR